MSTCSGVTVSSTTENCLSQRLETVPHEGMLEDGSNKALAFNITHGLHIHLNQCPYLSGYSLSALRIAAPTC